MGGGEVGRGEKGGGGWGGGFDTRISVGAFFKNKEEAMCVYELCVYVYLVS